MRRPAGIGVESRQLGQVTFDVVETNINMRFALH